MQQEKGFIKYVVIIIIILLVVFLSQQIYLRGYGKDLYSQVSGVMKGYWAKGSNWVSSQIYPKVSGEVSKRGEMIKREVNQEKQKVSENIGDKIKNYFSGVVDSIFHSGQTQQNNSCAQTQICPATQTKSAP